MVARSDDGLFNSCVTRNGRDAPAVPVGFAPRRGCEGSGPRQVSSTSFLRWQWGAAEPSNPRNMAAQRLDLLRAQRDLYGAAFIRLLWYDHAARIHDSTVRTCTPMSCATPSSVYLPSGHCDRDPWRRSY